MMGSLRFWNVKTLPAPFAWSWNSCLSVESPFLTAELRRMSCLRIKIMSPLPVAVQLCSCFEPQGWRPSSIIITEFSLLNLIPAPPPPPTTTALFSGNSLWKVHPWKEMRALVTPHLSYTGMLPRISDPSHSSQQKGHWCDFLSSRS